VIIWTDFQFELRSLAACDLPPNRKRDLISAVRRVAGLLGQPLELIGCDFPRLGAQLATINPPRSG
jgi:hypothetical protein